MQYIVICQECDSEYSIESEYGLLSDDPQYCCICKAPIEPELLIDEE